MIAWIKKEAVWKLWQDPIGKSQCGILGVRSKYVIYSENIICLLRNPKGSGVRSCQLKQTITILKQTNKQFVECCWKPSREKTLAMDIKWPGICNCPFRARSFSHEGLSWGGPRNNSAKAGRGISQIEREKDHKAQETCINRKSIPQWHPSLLH